MRLPAKTEPSSVVIAEPLIAQLVSTQPNFPLALQTPLEPTYDIRATGKMGLGMFAKCDLKPGDLILAERPALVYPNHFTSSNRELEAVFCVALEDMRVQDRIAYRKLAMSAFRSPTIGDLLRIATANCFQLPTNPPGGPNQRWTIGDYRAVYLDTSRINHSCSPNTVADFDFPSFSFIVRAVREIQKGHEITTTYSGALSKRNVERSLPFPCGCSVCTNLAALALSDSRRVAIQSYTPWSLVNRLESSIDKPDKLFADMVLIVRVFDDEGLQSLASYPMVLDLAGRLAKMLGKQTLADKQTQNAEMFYQMRPWYTQLKKFVDWLFGPEGSMPDRVRWAVSHFEEFEYLVEGWRN
ncbi:hypothetical protein B0H15DRAFT_787079 [Mycena belliarum]|uniref:SET domain-containing protein n=1 Tax=Mycena belliarum TaxID=1033014 RepID=A0AAD6TX75_9AGAR|nr:hypothetical protein B0H15DRAFT_787079 [Mycena belliae]